MNHSVLLTLFCLFTSLSSVIMTDLSGRFIVNGGSRSTLWWWDWSLALPLLLRWHSIDAVVRLECHPSMSNVSSTFELWYNDIFLVKTYDDLEFDDTVQPAKLPGEDDLDHVNINVIGFGAFRKNKIGLFSEISLYLRSTCMTIGCTRECEQNYSDNGETYNNSIDICVFSHQSSSACHGDSFNQVWLLVEKMVRSQVLGPRVSCMYSL